MVDIMMLLFAYILGLFPSAYIYSKIFKNVDVRHTGTGNVGTMNTLVNIGVLPGILTLISDFGKGFLIVYLSMRYASVDVVPILALFSMILAHNYNPLLDFQGGKGFGNLGGGLLLLSPITIPTMFAFTTVLLILFKVPKVTAGVAVLFFPIIIYLQTHDVTILLGTIPITLTIFSKHIHNFKDYIADWHSFEHLS
ncbi:MAG: glycerol-3-phosphate acyltransferase [Bacillota bacterium]